LPSKGTGAIETTLASQLRAKALAERDLAKERMDVHKLSCPFCNPKVKAQNQQA
jgi:hypothetical protein